MDDDQNTGGGSFDTSDTNDSPTSSGGGFDAGPSSPNVYVDHGPENRTSPDPTTAAANFPETVMQQKARLIRETGGVVPIGVYKQAAAHQQLQLRQSLAEGFGGKTNLRYEAQQRQKAARQTQQGAGLLPGGELPWTPLEGFEPTRAQKLVQQAFENSAGQVRTQVYEQALKDREAQERGDPWDRTVPEHQMAGIADLAQRRVASLGLRPGTPQHQAALAHTFEHMLESAQHGRDKQIADWHSSKSAKAKLQGQLESLQTRLDAQDQANKIKDSTRKERLQLDKDRLQLNQDRLDFQKDRSAKGEHRTPASMTTSLRHHMDAIRKELHETQKPEFLGKVSDYLKSEEAMGAEARRRLQRELSILDEFTNEEPTPTGPGVKMPPVGPGGGQPAAPATPPAAAPASPTALPAPQQTARNLITNWLQQQTASQGSPLMAEGSVKGPH